MSSTEPTSTEPAEPTSRDPLTPLARKVCDAMAAGFPDPAAGPLDPEALRAASRAGLGLRPVLPVRSVTERVAAGAVPVPVRIYDDGGEGGSEDEGRPLIVFFHGGGWVLCDLDTHDGLCRELAVRTGAVVISADYRRAPEHRFPAAADDAFTVLEWATGHARELGCDPARVVVAGDSSGGNLAASCALRARDGAGPSIAAQLLIYPVLDHRLAGDSASAYASGFFHTTAHMRWYWEQYIGPGGLPAHHAAASPGLAEDLAGLPPALVVLADCDPLRDEGLAYARRLAGVGVTAEVRLYPGVFHGFLGAVGVLPEAEGALAGAGEWVRGIAR